MDEQDAYDRSYAGTGPSPIYLGPAKDALNGWRINTPPVVESLDQTYEEIIENQGRSDNRGVQT